jgi:hypothetical protein
VGVLSTCSLRGKRGVGRETLAGGDRHLLMVGARGWKSGEGPMWGRHHVVEENVGVGGWRGARAMLSAGNNPTPQVGGACMGSWH